MTGIRRDEIIAQLGEVPYERFLLYLMGPYKSFNLTYILSNEDLERIDTETLPSPLRRLFRNREEIDEAKALLRRVQGSLRTDPGINAFLAVDIGVDTNEIDAVTQSIEYSRCSNAIAFIVPYLGQNFGVGEETGSVLENLSESHGDRLVFVHEDNVTSEMIRSARTRWDLRVVTYETEAELIDFIRQFVITIMNQELFGDLEYLP